MVTLFSEFPRSLLPPPAFLRCGLNPPLSRPQRRPSFFLFLKNTSSPRPGSDRTIQKVALQRGLSGVRRYPRTGLDRTGPDLTCTAALDLDLDLGDPDWILEHLPGCGLLACMLACLPDPTSLTYL